jgi:hypothetical protein
MNGELSLFWSELETSFPLGGARLRLRELLGDALEAELERAGVLVHRRVATSYPCVHHAGEGCPRKIFPRTNGSSVALCGNKVAECSPVEMSRADIESLSVSTERLGYVVGKALRLRVGVQAISGIPDTYRFGAFIPEPGVEHTVYFLTCSTGRAYELAVDALQTQAAGRSIAILVPTDRFISESLRRHAGVAGVPLIVLADVLGPGEDGTMRSQVDPLQLFSTAGIMAGAPAATVHVASAYVGEPGRPPVWRQLDQIGYQRLVARASRFSIFADELSRTVCKGASNEPIAEVPPGQFKWIRAAIDAPRGFDPGTGDDEGIAAKQLFQRARRVFDQKVGDGWSLFQTRMVDNHATYRFDPRPEVSFAFLFAPRDSDVGARSTVDDDQTPIEISLNRRALGRPAERRP